MLSKDTTEVYGDHDSDDGNGKQVVIMTVIMVIHVITSRQQAHSTQPLLALSSFRLHDSCLHHKYLPVSCRCRMAGGLGLAVMSLTAAMTQEGQACWSLLGLSFQKMVTVGALLKHLIRSKAVSYTHLTLPTRRTV